MGNIFLRRSSFIFCAVFLALGARANDDVADASSGVEADANMSATLPPGENAPAPESCEAASDLEALKKQSAISAEKRKIAEDNLAILKAGLAAKNLNLDQAGKAYEIGLKEVEFMTKQAKLEEEERFQAQFTAGKDPQRLAVPYDVEKKTLVISDRRIPLNGPIVSDTASYIEKRIAFYNLQDDKTPIFIVISSSPGGSVSAGLRILQSMKQSSAPVYVLVKQFAASMAAVITTLAEKSFAYPNAQILHHQVSNMGWGNTSDMEEMVKGMKEWQRRLLKPVAEKMGTTLELLVATMYERTRSGDWEEFADEAQKLKWVDEIPDRVIETAFLYHPDIVSDPRMRDTSASRSRAESESPTLSAEEKFVQSLRENLHLHDSIGIVKDGNDYKAVLPPLSGVGADVYAIHDPKAFFKGAK